MEENIRLLSQHQTDDFDTEYVNSSMFQLVEDHVNQESYKYTCPRLLDIGGGNGAYCDRFLHRYPNWRCTLVEPERSLINKNSYNQHKTLLNQTYQTLSNNVICDAIQFNWVLHHFVSDSYSKSCQAQQEGLEKAFKLLAPGGSILVFENFYEGNPLVELPSLLIYEMCASKLLERIAGKLGANTAGVGVCFHSEQYWRKLLIEAGFINVRVHHCYDFGNLSSIKKFILTLKHQRVGFITAKKPCD